MVRGGAEEGAFHAIPTFISEPSRFEVKRLRQGSIGTNVCTNHAPQSFVAACKSVVAVRAITAITGSADGFSSVEFDPMRSSLRLSICTEQTSRSACPITAL